MLVNKNKQQIGSSSELTILKRRVKSTTLGERTCFIEPVHWPGFSSARVILEKMDQSISVSCLASSSGETLLSGLKDEAPWPRPLWWSL